ncbi:restriction endonuclease subunit S [Marinobacter piscensis]|uniref:restriction endonuclease subunit S n=1 Tax=Marinobacter piscensis TaxID=1562308 RepID=UPI0011A2A3FC|nr:restriction endonuclease subunit S [Marinobacter piscensis]
MSFDESVSLPDGWQIMTVDQLVSSGALAKPLDGNHGGIHPKASDYVEHGIPFVMASDLQGGQVDLSNCKFISEVQANSLRKGFAQAGDVLLSHKATIGRTAIVQASEYPFLMLTPQVTYYRVLDSQKLVPNYLKAYFDSHFFQSILALWAGSGSTRAYLGITGQLKLPIVVPPIAFQKLVAAQAESLNDKIQLNHQTNQTLEQVAQAIFKSWFVDFEPVKAKIAALEAGGSEEEALLAAMQAISGKGEAELTRLQAEQPEQYTELRATAELFPSAMQESELGEIPEGWECSALDQIAKYQNGLALQKFRPNNEDDYLPVVKIAQLKKGYADHEEKASPNIKPDCIIDNGDIVFSWSGSLMVDTWCGGRAALNQHLFKVTSENYPKWLYFHFTRHHLEEFQRIAADKAVTMGHIKREHLKRALCAVPNRQLIENAGKFLGNLLDKQIELRLESTTLSDLRDTLLPKLLSGELKTPALEI